MVANPSEAYGTSVVTQSSGHLLDFPWAHVRLLAEVLVDVVTSLYTTTLEIWVTNNLRIADLGALAVKLAPERERVGLARQASAERDQRPLEQPPIARKAAKVKLAIQSRQRFIFSD